MPKFEPTGVISASATRAAVGAGGTSLYLALGAWSYSAAITGDIRFAAVLNVLAFAAAFAALLVSERFGAFAHRSRTWLNICLGLGMAALNVLLFTWEWQHQPQSAIDSDPQVEMELDGSRLVLVAQPLMPAGDGTFTFGVQATNIGKLSVAKFGMQLSVIVDDKPLQRGDEDKSMATTKSQFLNNINPPEYLSKINSNQIFPGAATLIRVPSSFPPSTVAAIKAGRVFEKMAAIFISTDVITQRYGSYFYNELCGYYDARTNNVINCYAHNGRETVPLKEPIR